MNRILKSTAFIALIAGAMASCDDQVNVDNSDASGNAAALPVKHLGCTHDGSGNVIVNQNLFLDSDTIYVLHNYFRLQTGKTITIEAGTRIEGGKKGVDNGCGVIDPLPGVLIIERGAKIIANGTSALPIVFTSHQAVPAPGDWGGVAILGKADANIAGNKGSTNSGVNGVGIVEGLNPNTLTGGRYGNGDLTPGSYNADNSGSLKFVRIQYAGDQIVPGNELNGLTLGGVGSGTVLENIQVHKSADDAFEFFGGTVNGKYLVASGSADDDFDTDQGYSGKLQFGFVARATNNPYLADLPLNGGESNGDNDDSFTANLTSTQFSNFTIIGPYQNNGSALTLDPDYRAGVYFRDLSRKDLFNSVIFGFPYGLEISSETGFPAQFNVAASLDATKIDVRNSIIVVPFQSVISGITTAATRDDATATDFNATFTAAGLGNTIITASATTGTVNTMAGTAKARINTGAWNFVNSATLPVPLPTAGSPLLSGASFSLLSGFTVVTYRGAFDSSTNWLSGWTVWN